MSQFAQTAAPGCGPYFDDAALETEIRGAIAAELGFIPDAPATLSVALDPSWWQGSEPAGFEPAQFPHWAWNDAGVVTLRVRSKVITLSKRRKRGGGTTIEVTFKNQAGDVRPLAVGRGETQVHAWNAILKRLRSWRHRTGILAHDVAAELSTRGLPA